MRSLDECYEVRFYAPNGDLVFVGRVGADGDHFTLDASLAAPGTLTLRATGIEAWLMAAR